MTNLLLAFALCSAIQPSDPNFMPTECHELTVKFVESPLAMDLAGDKTKIRAFIEQTFKDLAED